MKKHNCKQLKLYNKDNCGCDSGVKIIYEKIPKGLEAGSDLIKLSSWLLDLPSGQFVDIYYCPFCGGHLDERNA